MTEASRFPVAAPRPVRFGARRGVSFEWELLDRTHFHDPRSSRGQAHHPARRALFELIEGWYHPHRRHQGLGRQSPMAFERSYQDAA